MPFLVGISILSLALVLSAIAIGFFGHLNKRAQLKAEVEKKALESAYE